MDNITKTTKTVFPTTRSKNNHPPQHSRSFTTAITSANPSVSTKFRKKQQLMLATKWKNCRGVTILTI